MILENAFPQFTKITQTIDEALSFVNLIIRTTPKEPPYCRKGTLFIPDKYATDQGEYCAALAHEGEHLREDPVTFENYRKGIDAIKSALNVDTAKAGELANTASDLIIAHRMSRTPALKPYESAFYQRCYKADKEREKKTGQGPRETILAFAKIYGFKTQEKSQLWPQIEKALKVKPIDRSRAYVMIAEAFNSLPTPPPPPNQNGPGDKGEKQDGANQKNKESQSEKGEGQQEGAGNPFMPICPDSEDLEQAGKQALKEAKTEHELRDKLQTIADLAAHAGQDAPEIKKLLASDIDRLIAFYNAKAAKVIFALDFPKKRKRSGSVLGSRKWQLSDGLEKMDIAKAIRRYGRNIPLVTSVTPLTWNKTTMQQTGAAPRPLKLSFDTSSSMGQPMGTMTQTADIQAVAFFAILNAAQKLDQEIGFTLWDTRITTREGPCNMRRFNDLRRAFFRNYYGSNTNAAEAIDEMRQNPSLAFFLITDGCAESKERLIAEARGIRNALVILLMPRCDETAAKYWREHNVEDWKAAFGANRIITVENESELPKIALAKWREWFWAK